MSQEVSSQLRKLVVALIIIAALFMIFVEPFLVEEMTYGVQAGQTQKINKLIADNDPMQHVLMPARVMVGWAYPLWMSLAVLGGFVLLLVAKSLYNGAVWAKGVSLVCLAMPACGGAYMLVPYMRFVYPTAKAFPPALIVMAAGLIPYFAILWFDRGDLLQKAIDGWVFLMLGVTAAEAWANGHAAHRILLGHPKMPLYAEGIFVLQPGRNLSWLALVLLVGAIYFAATRSKVGWYLAMSGAAAAAAAGIATHLVRATTWDWMFQFLMGLAIIIPLLIPMVKERLVETPEERLVAEGRAAQV